MNIRLVNIYVTMVGVVLFREARFTTAASGFTPDYPVPCESSIYCYGQMLHTVQMSRIFSDSKTFVDMTMKYPPSQVHKNFTAMRKEYGPNPPGSVVKEFVNACFGEPGSELEDWTPDDWTESPDLLDSISDSSLKQWGSDLNAIWKQLGRKIKADVENNPDRYSLIYLPNPTIVPGGRFRETYYWDSYWIIRGLLACQMPHTVQNMIGNFLHFVETIGLIPNGGRVYYDRRSQPPFLTAMVVSYMEYTNNVTYLGDILDTLVKEFDFWHKNRTVTVNDAATNKNYTMYRYYSSAGGPRPESYLEDSILVEGAFSGKLSTDLKEWLYVNLKSGAESGWDYSTRWFRNPKAVSLTNLDIINILPVDLNALLYYNANQLSQWCRDHGKTYDADRLGIIADEILQGITALLWDEEYGVWFDYDIQTGTRRQYFYPSNIVPLWAHAYDKTNTTIVTKVIQYLKNSKALSYPGGIPASLEHSGEQWDFPNGWPPCQHLIIMGLDGTGVPEAKALAFELAQRWVTSNWMAYEESQPNAMFEKYDVTVVGLPGGGGEYDVQLGFGWTNGVVLDLLKKYGERLHVEPYSACLQDKKGDCLAASSTPEPVHVSVWPAMFASTIAVFASVWIG